MWLAIRTFFVSNWLAIVEKLGLLFGIMGAVWGVYRAGSRAQENESMKEELKHAKEALNQDAIIAGNGDVDGMRSRLSEALRRKHNS